MYWKVLDALRNGWEHTILELLEAGGLLNQDIVRIDLGFLALCTV